jgi:hypothetical protein
LMKIFPAIPRFRQNILDICKAPVLSKKSEIKQSQKSRECRLLDNSAPCYSVAPSPKFVDGFLRKRYGPAHRGEPNATGVL